VWRGEGFSEHDSVQTAIQLASMEEYNTSMMCDSRGEGGADKHITVIYEHYRASLTSFLHTERYMELLKESKIRGYIFDQQNYVPK